MDKKIQRSLEEITFILELIFEHIKNNSTDDEKLRYPINAINTRMKILNNILFSNS